MNYARVTYMLFRTRVRHPAMLFGLLFTPCLFAVIEHFFPGESKFHAYLPIALASWSALLIPHNIICLREQGVLARLRLNTLTPRAIAVSLFIVDLILCVCCIAATIALASIVFSKTPSGAIAPLVGGIALATVAFFALGFVASTIYINTKITNIVGNLLMIGLMLTSGIIELPEQYCKYSPTWHTTILLEQLWEGTTFHQIIIPFAVLSGMAIILGGFAIQFFRWKPTGNL